MPISLAEADKQLITPGSMFEIEEVEVDGHTVKVWKNAPRVLGDILELSRAHGDADFVVYEDDRMTFEEHYRKVVHLANILRERFGVETGDRVAIAMRNLPEWVVSFWAAAVAGAVVVPLNAWWTADELEYGLADSGAVVLLADEQRAARLAPVVVQLKDLRTVIVARAEKELPEGMLDFAQVLGEIPDSPQRPQVDIGPDSNATIFYTSGTTGRPKGALGTHRNICNNPMHIIYSATRNSLRNGEDSARGKPGSGLLLSVPLFHATGCHSTLVTSTLVGGKLVMMYKWDAARALELIEREKLNGFGGVPSMVMQVLDHPDFATRDTSTVTSVSYGGAPAPPDLVRRIKRHFPDCTASNGYGMTETSSVTSLNVADSYIAKPDSVGTCMPVMEVKVVDADGQSLPEGEMGELMIKGPNVVRGYWNRPEATAQTFEAGWVHTGDMARLDEEGFIFILDRAKDMLIRGGENIYCVEVETVLYDHPAISDAAVIGIPHPILGEEVGAVVQVRSGFEVSQPELQEWVREHLAAFKVPVKIWFSDEPLPRNPAGKILKRNLRDELVGQP